MNDDENSPWRTLAAMPDVTIRITRVEDGCLGWWDRERGEIVLDKRQSLRQMRCTLMHELEHVRRGDEDTSHVSPVLAVRQEIAASTRAARRLVSMDRLVDALLWSQDERELAEMLHVDEDTLRIRLLTLTDDEHAVIDARLWQAEGQTA